MPQMAILSPVKEFEVGNEFGLDVVRNYSVRHEL
jgi:hypothetical protein